MSFANSGNSSSDDDDDDTYEDETPVADRVTAEPPEKTADDAFLPESEEAGSSEE